MASLDLDHLFLVASAANLSGEGIASGPRSVTFDVALRARFDAVVTHGVDCVDGRALARKTFYERQH